jgi:uncharacterized protein (UPF0248 family)
VQPLDQLLDRITWDAEFGRGRFAIGYLDRVAGAERVVAFEEVQRDPGGHTLSLLGEGGMTVHIPLHRVRTVFKNGVVIWQRQPAHRG